MNKYLIIINLGKKAHISLVNDNVWQWIFSPYAHTTESSYEDLIPNIEDQINSTAKKVLVERRTYQQDRALSAPGEKFSSIKEMLGYCKDHGVDIVDTYEHSI